VAQPKKVGSFPSIMVMVSLTIALFLIGVCGLLALRAKKLAQLVKENIEVQVYLAKDLRAGQIDTLYKAIAAKPYTALKDEKYPQINFMSKDVAAEKFIKETKEDFKEFLGENPLRDAYIVKIKEEYFQEEKLKEIQRDLQNIEGVYEVGYVENFVDEIGRNITRLYLIMSGLVFLLLIIILILVNNTIRLAFYSQRFLIRSMQLVGATHGFIRRPFLMNALWQGIVGGLIASAGLLGIEQAIMIQFPEYALVQDLEKMIIVIGFLLLLGILISLVSTYRAVEKFLGMQLDDLY
jgi:cell division transport system permease protein